MKRSYRWLAVAWLLFVALASGTASAVAATPMVVAGDKHNCALQSSGNVVCWGSNSLFGQLGDNTKIDRAYPVPVAAVADAVKLAAGGDRTCAILANTQVRCWGAYLSYYEGQPFDRLHPLDNFEAVAISVTSSSTCLVRLNGRVTCVSSDASNSSYVVRDESGVENAVDITSSPGRTCILLASGQVQCRGVRYFVPDGFLGRVPVTELRPTLVDGLNDAVHLSTLEAYTCAVRRTGTIQCWSDFVGPQDASPVPGFVDVAQIQLGIGGQHCAILKNGELLCLGNNDVGKLGNGSTVSSSTPVKVAISASATSVALGSHHSCATLVSGLVQCWGDSSSGQLGTGAIAFQPQPMPVVNARDAVDVSTGKTHSCAVLRGGGIACWGKNENGKLGDGTQTDRNYAALVKGIQNASSVASGGYHSCALLTDRTVKCWGRNNSGQLGDGSFNDTLEGVTVSGLTDVSGLVAGSDHTCAVRGNGDVLCWGANTYSTLGQTYVPGKAPNPYKSATPLLVSGIPKARSLSVGPTHTCALGIAGEVHCWGHLYTQLPQSWKDGIWREDIPTASAQGGACALTAWGRVWCELGRQTPPALTAPVADVAQLAGNCALLLSGAVQCWDGRAWVGKLGIGDAVRFSVYSGSACAVLATGRVKCWGSENNDLGQFGLGNGQLGLGWVSGLLPQNVSGPGGNAALDLQDVSLTLTALQADMVFAFAELSAPLIFEPLPRPSFTVEGLRVREFANGHYLGVNLEGTPRLYYKGPQSNNTILDLGLLSGWFGLSKM